MLIFVCRVPLSFLLAFWQPNRMFTLFLRLFFLQILKFWSTLFWRQDFFWNPKILVHTFWRLLFLEILKFWICSFFVAKFLWRRIFCDFFFDFFVSPDSHFWGAFYFFRNSKILRTWSVETTKNQRTHRVLGSQKARFCQPAAGGNFLGYFKAKTVILWKLRARSPSPPQAKIF